MTWTCTKCTEHLTNIAEAGRHALKTGHFVTRVPSEQEKK
jgi:hypothetical protein